MSGHPQQPSAQPLIRDRPREHTRSSDAEHAILEATESLLSEVPLHELSVAQIISAAGISRATFYFYFSSKFAVLTTLADRAITEIFEASLKFIDRTSELPTEAAMRQRIQTSAAIWEANRAVLRASVENWNAIPELREVWTSALGRLTDALAREIDSERAAGRAPEGPDSRRLAATLVWTTERCLYIGGLGIGGPLQGEDDTVDALTRIWLGAMYGSAGLARA